MGRAADPENVRKIAEVNRLVAEGVYKDTPTACRAIGLSVHTYNSWRSKQREREEEAQSWAYVGKRHSRLEQK